ncbi:MAG: surface antigen [Betaproteobacteria bacterium]|nr:surface antigen [Betaproteobacteria bacterium]
MTKSSTIIIFAAAAFAAVLTGCAPGLGGSSYAREQARREQTVRMGVVESVREVKLEGTRSGVGPAAGAVVGGVAGSTIGRGTGSVLGAVVGAVAGGIGGQAAEQGLTGKRGVEVTVKLDNGQMVAIMQEADETFRPGDRVRILSDGATSRVTR